MPIVEHLLIRTYSGNIAINSQNATPNMGLRYQREAWYA